MLGLKHAITAAAAARCVRSSLVQQPSIGSSWGSVFAVVIACVFVQVQHQAEELPKGAV